MVARKASGSKVLHRDCRECGWVRFNLAPFKGTLVLFFVRYFLSVCLQEGRWGMGWARKQGRRGAAGGRGLERRSRNRWVSHPRVLLWNQPPSVFRYGRTHGAWGGAQSATMPRPGVPFARRKTATDRAVMGGQSRVQSQCVCVCVRIIHCRPPKPPGCAISGWELHAAPTIPTLRIAETSEMNMGN